MIVGLALKAKSSAQTRWTSARSDVLIGARHFGPRRIKWYVIENTALYSMFFAAICLLIFAGNLAAQMPPELRLGRAGHAFDHLSTIGLQAEAAASAGSTIIYASGVGEAGYFGLPPQSEFKSLCDKTSAYNREAKSKGIELSIGYLCATSIVKLDNFDKNWTEEFRAQFKTRPADWRQQDRSGKPLASWYGGDYQPACMSNPNWRAYERAMVRHTMETGHDGVFFDNPTVHPQGCYCSHCMKAFGAFFDGNASKPIGAKSLNIHELRALADKNRELFLRFRSTIARDFLGDMRESARAIHPKALVTCNNSLNTPSVYFSQCRMYGYNINEMSKVEDLVVVEDMNNQPRIEASGQTVEYGPTYKMLHAISRGKPVVAVTIAGNDYHTPPNLMRLAMAEAAAHNASYLSWPTWPEAQRKRMVDAIRPQADFLRRKEEWLNDAPIRADVVVFLPFRRWVQSDSCPTGDIAAALTKANLQYKVISESDFSLAPTNGRLPVLVVESRAVFSPDEQTKVETFEQAGGHVVVADRQGWTESLSKHFGLMTDVCRGPETVRMVVHDHPKRTVVHLYNLDIQRLASFEDQVTPATDVSVAVRTPFKKISFAHLSTADEGGSSGEIRPQSQYNEGNETVVFLNLPPLKTSAIITIEGQID